jgi:hypothetical protein
MSMHRVLGSDAMQQQQLDEGERLRRQEFNRDIRAAIALGMDVEEYAVLREASIVYWTHWLHAEMIRLKVDDPQQVLPQIMARMEQRTAQIAREAAKIAATEVLRERMRKVIS